MIAGLEGLGQWVLLAARAYKSADIFAGVVLLGAIGVVANAALSSLESGPPRTSRSGLQRAAKRWPDSGSKKCAWAVSNESLTVSPSWIRIRSFSTATISVCPACAIR